MPSTSKPIFLLGAGFNADAKAEVGPVHGESIYIGRHEIECSYPLVGELAKRCFGLASPPHDRSIEQLFEEAAAARNLEPMRHLTDALMKADYYLAPRLIPAFDAPPNCYSAFFERFSGSSFLTFNYDSLPELFLLREGCWYPQDGYGVPVSAEVVIGHEHLCERSSSSFVLHLHGSLCLHTSIAIVQASGERIACYKQRDQPKYLFEPDSIGALFNPFERAPIVPGYERPEERVIAPVPDKAEGLRKEFIAVVYRRAKALINVSNAPVIAIGYSFNEHDRASFHSVISAIEEKASGRVLLVLPEADKLKRRLEVQYPGIAWAAEPQTFASWVKAGFPGVA